MTHFVTGTVQCGVRGVIDVAVTIVADPHTDDLFGAEGEVAAEAWLKVEVAGHLAFIGAETDICNQLNGEKRRHLCIGEVGFHAAKYLDDVADIIVDAWVGVTSPAVVLVTSVLEPV